MQIFTAGTQFGHYRLLRHLGQGGMGIVYEAEDQKLGRHVALKFLPHAMQKDPAALERFWREARTASSLNHPGICTIHELNESAESPFLVMELLDGESLDKLYHGRPLAYPRLLELGIQLADALAAAHQKGILHRDIKPANIFMVKSGQAKLLDFGLAKFDGIGDRFANDETVNALAPSVLTSPGTTLGTVAYMSPEQARGGRTRFPHRPLLPGCRSL